MTKFILCLALFLAFAAIAQAQTYIIKVSGDRVIAVDSRGVEQTRKVVFQGTITLSGGVLPTYHGEAGEVDQSFTGRIVCTDCAPPTLSRPRVNLGGTWRTRTNGDILLILATGANGDIIFTVDLPNVAADGESYEGYLTSVGPWPWRLQGTIRLK